MNLYSVWRYHTNASKFLRICSSTYHHGRLNDFHDDSKLKPHYDAVVVGAGHNGLVAAAYLQRSGRSVCVLERRHVIGGAAVTEEIIPGFKFSRASYLLSLLRPIIIKDLQLKRHGLKTYPRSHFSYTPLLTPGGTDGRARSLLLSVDPKLTAAQIAQFSHKDVENYTKFNAALLRLTRALDPLFDAPPYDHLLHSRLTSLASPTVWSLIKFGLRINKKSDDLLNLQELLTKPCGKILERWFESEPLKATLATDALIGSRGPYSSHSGYVLLHHCMGQLEGSEHSWGFVAGGMGTVSNAIANSAAENGAHIFTNKVVKEILVDKSSQRVEGVALDNGQEIRADLVLSNATPHVTYLQLLPKGCLPEDFARDISLITYNASVTKINIAVDKLPSFTADPNKGDNRSMRHHESTIHLNSASVDVLQQAYVESLAGRPSTNPMIEMTIPSVLDPTLAPPGCHVVQLFSQYTPYQLADGQTWNEETKNQYADSVFDAVERYAPGFKDSVIGRDILTPLDLETVFGLTKGDIFHGALTLDQYYNTRPTAASASYACPIRGLYICGSGAHPGGGVSGAPGRLSALAALKYKKA